jgi:non-specific serine/threonine protein kinase/serine/threonine-protein kinase
MKLGIDAQETRPTEPAQANVTGHVPERIGPYKILNILGQGGMGIVYLAEQTEPVRRRVALKVIKHGMDTDQVVARFETERQALALMDHPAIAKVFDAGVTPDRRPYFVMEHVPGVPITEHCDRHKLTTRERLDLFLEVCEGVQHAHHKAIVHRDLKPSNVLVSVVDGRRRPKIIDFGVAKAVERKLTDRSLQTELGMLIGTPAYMSPEQAVGRDIDTRTDVYGLGVMLYELLVGALPFEPEELRSSGLDAMVRKICAEVPPKPSTRLSTLGEASTTYAALRRTEPSTLRRELAGDLDWITMKALEKDRARRYDSPRELAADIERHLTHEPVLAGPPSVAYQARKFIRRHRVGVSVAAVAIVALLGFAIRERVQAGRIAREADAAKQVSEFLIGVRGRRGARTHPETRPRGGPRTDAPRWWPAAPRSAPPARPPAAARWPRRRGCNAGPSSDRGRAGGRWASCPARPATA